MATIPSELIIDILSRLPVKSLCRFKCVSKSFMALITDPWFAKIHLARTRRQRLVFASDSLHCLDLEASCHHKYIDTVIDLDFPSTNNSKHGILLRASCNGLLCLSINPEPDVLFLYNPSTRELKKVPDSGHRIDHDIYGFGYDPSTDDYKFVQFSRGKSIVHAMIFSLRNNIWESSVEDNYPDASKYCNSPKESTGISVNGAIHWVFEDDEDLCTICAFDLAEAKFKTLPRPDVISNDGVYSYSIGVISECLCLFYTKLSLNDCELWIMKEYGKKESWNRILLPNSYGSVNLRPLCFLKNSDLILVGVNFHELEVYDRRDGTYKKFAVDGFEPEDLIMDFAQVYVESLVSPINSKTLETEAMATGTFPSDLIAKILSRWPIKFLCRFKKRCEFEQ